jgi:RecJ-like exonuclease
MRRLLTASLAAVVLAGDGLIIQQECRFCDGNGRVHSGPFKGNDPWDEGKPCPKCDGAGVIDVALEDEIND